MSNFAKGGAKAREASKSAFRKTNFLNLKDGESIVVRLVDDSDDWIFTSQHAFVPTKGAPRDAKPEAKDKWPKNMNAVCRYTKNEGEYVFPEFAETGCFICDHMVNPADNKKYPARIKLWARAVQRDEIKGTQAMVDANQILARQVGKTVGFQDHMQEIQETDDKGESTGKSSKEPLVLVINMSMRNFFGDLQAAADAYGTALDRDYKITRRGTKKDTEYDIVAMDAIQGYTLEDDAVRAKYEKLVDLEKIITEQAADEHYARFFDTTKEAPSRGGDRDDDDDAKDAPANFSGEGAVQSTAPDPALMQGMRDRLMGSAPAQSQDA